MICPSCGHSFTTTRTPAAPRERFPVLDTSGMTLRALFAYFKKRALYDDACFLYRCLDADGELSELAARCARLIMDLECDGATPIHKTERASILTAWRMAMRARADARPVSSALAGVLPPHVKGSLAT